jgi:glycosyltransferase involved in cell wall biosynthesis/GT2 family glycosyltransferase
VRVDVVIVTHQSAAQIERAVAPLREHAEVVVVDNASSDGSSDRARIAGVTTVIENDVNAGFASAANQGARHGIGDAILFLNPDAAVAWGSVEQLAHTLEEQPDLAVVAPRIFYGDGREQRVWWPFPSARSAWREAVALHRVGAHKTRSPLSGGFVIGTCFLVRRRAFDALGGFDTRYWLYGEEADFCRRAADSGWDIAVVDTATAEHAGGASGAELRSVVEEHFARGSERFVFDHDGRRALVLYRCANLVGATIRALAPGARTRRQLHRRRAARLARTVLSNPFTVPLDSHATGASAHTLVVCSHEAWDDVWRRNQFLVRELLARDANLRVLFVEPPFDWLHEMRREDRARARGRRRRGLRSVRADGRVFAFEPGKLFPRTAGPLADRSLRRQLLRAARRLGFEQPTLWINDAAYAPLVVETGWPSVYDVTDDWLQASISPQARRRLARRERTLLRGCDAVVVCSDELARTRGRARPDLVIVPNAVDTALFQSPVPRPSDLPASPTAVYVGTLHEDRLDVALITDLAERSDVHVVLVGPNALSPDSSAQLTRHPNVMMLGEHRYEDVPAYLQHADVLIVPHVVTPFTESLDPIKAYECLTVATPTVATPVAGFRGLGPPVRVVERRSFVDAVGAMLTAPPTAESAMERGSLPSWSDRAADFARVLEQARCAHASSSPHLRVVIVDHCAQLSGGELALARLLDAVENVDCHVILGEHGPLEARLRESNASVEVLPLDPAVRHARRAQIRASAGMLGRIPATISAIAALRRRLRELQPDVVHTNSLKAAVYGGIAARLAGAPVVWHARDRITSDYVPAQAALAIKVLARFVPNGIVFNSQTTRDTYGDTPIFAIIPSPIVYDSVAPALAARATDEHAPARFAMVGRLAPWKGQDVFLQAFAHAFGTGNERAVVAGSAMFGEDDYAQGLKALADDLGIAEQVEFAGFVPDVDDVLARVDVLVHASVLPEPFGQVVVEGMAIGLAVIAAAAGGPAEVITDGVDGVLVAPGDVDALARAMRALASDPERRRELGHAAHARAADFASDRVAAAVRHVWALVARRRGRARASLR